MNWQAYYRLARFDKPVGIYLLWAPTAWALWLANQGHPPLKLVLLFLAGTVLMRAAGCVINDLADRHIDCHVNRTCHRPLTTGEMTVFQALIFLFGLLMAALLILMQLPTVCVYFAIFAVIITIIYPFCKRWVQAPQVVLGLAFSMGIPMAYAASHVAYNSSMLMLLLINLLWTIAYDTQYAMIDRPDDALLGVKSTAILLGSLDIAVISILQCIMHLLWLVVAYVAGLSSWFFVIWLLCGGILILQYFLLNTRDERNYLRAFQTNGYYGLLIWMGMLGLL